MNDVNYSVIKAELDHIKNTIEEIKQKLDRDFVTRAEHLPVARIAYGIIALMGIGLVGAIMKLVLK